MLKTLLRWLLTLFMVTMGVLHFVRPEPFARIVPPFLPAPEVLVAISGVAEVLGGLGLQIARLRRAAAWGLIALYIAVFPANIYMAVEQVSLADLPADPVLLWARLPLQLVFIAWAYWFTRPTARGPVAVLALIALLGACDRADPPAADPAVAEASWVPPVVSYPSADDARPFRLSEVGLYRDLGRRELAPDLIAFEPRFRLWSDGASKRRWLRLPAGTTIDTSDMDHWELPVGGMLFKEFTRDGVLVETRLIARTGPGAMDYFMGAFVWLPDGSDAVYTPEGLANAGGTPHDVPARQLCWSCHNGEPGRVIGLSALQLAEVRSGASLAQLAADGRLSQPPDPTLSLEVPGDAATAAVIGHLHANCGNCHNPHGAAWSDTGLDLRLSPNTRTVEETGLYRTALNARTESSRVAGCALRVAPGQPEASALLVRMAAREPGVQMPPIGTELADDQAVAQVRAWIQGLQ